jgi:O-methyltransferase
MGRFWLKLYVALTVIPAIFFILSSKTIHPSYRFGPLKKLGLGLRMLNNWRRIPSGTSFKSHLAMALKLLEMPPEEKGMVVECGTWKGGSAVNLSLVCRIVGRKLRIYDSFQGLPPGDDMDREAVFYEAGDYCGTLDEVRSNLQRYGAIEVCEFVQGWFDDTLPSLNEPVALAFVDVDLEASLTTCVRALWANLTPRGYIFIDEFVSLNYCALFWSERWWREAFGQTPPGLIGAGTGLPLGEFYIGPFSEADDHPGHHATAAAYTRRDFSGVWSYYPQHSIAAGA